MSSLASCAPAPSFCQPMQHSEVVIDTIIGNPCMVLTSRCNSLLDALYLLVHEFTVSGTTAPYCIGSLSNI